MEKSSNNKTGSGLNSKGDSKAKSNAEEMGLGEKIRPSSGHRSSSSKSLQTSRPTGGTALDDFEVLSTIGTGSYGTCKKIRRKKDGKVLVWKELDYGAMTETEKQMLVSEVNLLRELKSPYIVRYYDRIIDRARTTIYIIMEYCKGGDLSTIISRCKKEVTYLFKNVEVLVIHVANNDCLSSNPNDNRNYLDEELIWKILVQLLLALQECHQRKNGRAVLHRDMKPANVFLDTDKNVKLGDFGLARVLHHETSFANTYVGTPYYMSPELVNNMSYNEKSDVWSLGCVLYELCALHPPFIASSQTELNKKIRLGEFSRIPLKYTDDLNDTIAKMLHVEVVKRPSIEELLASPVVSSQQTKMERQQASHQSNSSTDLKNREAELRALERELEQKKKDLDNRERELNIREKLVEDKDKCAAVREKLADEKFARAESLLQEYELKMRLDTERILRGDREATAVASDSSSDGLASCLTKKRDPDTPKKKVSFDMYGKENLRFKDRYRDPLSKYSDYDSSYIQELLKRQELKDRLYQVKNRTTDTRGSDRSRNLLLFR